MADIALVITIPEDSYKATCNGLMLPRDVENVVNAIKNGTALPKGHGRLIDADVLDRDLENTQVNLGDALSEAFDDGLTWASEVASKLPTIIEADKENEG